MNGHARRHKRQHGCGQNQGSCTGSGLLCSKSGTDTRRSSILAHFDFAGYATLNVADRNLAH
jgi:hypothetical protein